MAENSPLIPDPLLPNDEQLPEELVGNLDDDDNRLSDVADKVRESFKEKTPEQRQLEQIKQQQLHEKEVERSQQLADKLKSTKQAAKNSTSTGANQAAAKQAEQRAAGAARRSVQRGAQAAGDAAKKAAQQAAKAIGQAVKKLVVSLVEKNPYVWLAVGIILLVIIIVVLIIALFSLGGGGGKGYPQYPKTTEEKYASTVSLALANDARAKPEVVIAETNKLKDKLKEVKTNAQKKYGSDSGKIAAVTKDVDAALALADQIIAASNNAAERGKLIDQFNEKLKSLQSTYSDLFFVAGTCADLKPYLDSKQFQVLTGPNGALIVKGQMKNAANQVWPASQDLCRALLIGLKAGYKITTNSLSYTHDRLSKSGFQSRHWCGAAIDIGQVNGQAVTSSNTAAAELTKLWYDSSKRGDVYVYELIVPSKYKQYELKANADHQYSSSVQSGHEDHIHLSGRIEDKRC